MATILKEANFNGTNGSHFKIRLSYDLSQSQANNTSTIKYYLYMISMDGYSGSGSTCKGYINGSQVGTFTSIGVNTTKQIGTKSTTVTHNNDGTKSVSYSASVDTPWSLGDASLSGTLTLPKINRLATVTSASNFTDEENPTLSFSNPAGFTVYPYLNFYDNNNNLVYQLYRNSKSITSPYTWNITSEERSALWRATNKQQTYKVTVGVDTYNGTTKLGNNSKTQTMTYVNAEPSQSTVFTEINPKVIDVLGNANADTIIQNVSQLKLVSTPTVKKSATVSKILFEHNNLSVEDKESPYEYTFTVINSKFKVTIVDSRGYSIPTEYTKSIIEYTPIDITQYSFKRYNPTSSDIVFNATIKYKQTTFKNTANVPTIKWKVGEQGTLNTISSSDYTMDTTNDTITITNLVLSNVLSYQNSEKMYLYVNDLLTQDTENMIVTKGIPTFDAGEHDFQVNGDLFVADVNRENRKEIRDLIYPIGSIYMSINDTNPSLLFGGTWEQLKDRFLVGAGDKYVAGANGGSETHDHLYRVGYRPYYGCLVGNDNKAIMLYDYRNRSWNYAASDTGLPDSNSINKALTKSENNIHAAEYSVMAHTDEANNIPPYLSVYMWKRTA